MTIVLRVRWLTWFTMKIPVLRSPRLHIWLLIGIYLSPLKQCKDEVCQDTNIFRSLFHNAVNQLNGRNLSDAEIDRLVAELTIKLSNDDLGRAFYKILLDGMDGLRLIDLDDMSRNTYHVVTELPYQNGDDEFRPDITLLINGLPLAFIEVKKPNNRDGIIAEHKRINSRFKKKGIPTFREYNTGYGVLQQYGVWRYRGWTYHRGFLCLQQLWQIIFQPFPRRRSTNTDNTSCFAGRKLRN